MSDEFNIDQVISVDFEADSELNVQVGTAFQGASIDDTVISTKKTWSSQKISDELNTKADDSATTAALALKADSADVYTKTQTYTKIEVDTALEDKPDAWEGTQAEYDALSVKDPDTIYFITDTNGSGHNFQPVIYSTEEREIGVWTDGKPLYEKTYYSDSPITVSRNSWSGTGITITNVALIAFCSAVAVDGSYQSSLLAYISNNELKLQTPRSSDTTVNYITLRYTKTTDTAGSGIWTPQGVPAIHYSEDEQVVGTWIDGSTLYEKTFTATFTNIAQNTPQNMADVSGLGITDVIRIFGRCKYDATTPTTQPTLYESLGAHFYCYVYPSGYLQFSQVMTTQITGRTYEVKVTIQYTKSSS